MTLRTIFLATLVASAGLARADFLYGVRRPDNVLVEIDLVTFATTILGPTGRGGQGGDLIWVPSGQGTSTLHWVPGVGNATIYSLDRFTGRATSRGVYGDYAFEALLPKPGSKNLYAFDSGRIYEVDPSDAFTVLVGSGPTAVRGACYVPGNGLIVHDTATSAYYRMEKNLTFTRLGPSSHSALALVYSPRARAVFGCDTSGLMFRVSVTTWAETVVGSNLGEIHGLAYQFAIPAPKYP